MTIKNTYSEISISIDGIWAGSGKFEDGCIRDCGAVLGNDAPGEEDTDTQAIYDAIEAAIAAGESRLTWSDGREFTWRIEAGKETTISEIRSAIESQLSPAAAAYWHGTTEQNEYIVIAQRDGVDAAVAELESTVPDTTGYEVAVPDSLDNTGLDGAVFPSRDEAEQAMRAVRLMFPNYEFAIRETNAPPTTTFAEWDAAGW